METTAVNISTSRLTRGYLIAIIGTICWSSTAIFIRYLTQSHTMPPLVLAFWRDLFVSAALVIAFAIFNPPSLRARRSQIGFLVLYGLELSIFNTLWTISVSLNGAAVSTVLAYSSAAFTAILGWRFFAERLDRVKITAVLLSILGCALVSGAYDPAAWRLNTLGILTGLLSGIAFAGYSLLGKASSNRGIPPWTALLYTFGIAALFLFGYNFLMGWQGGVYQAPNLLVLGSSLSGWGALLLLAIGPTIAGYGLYTVSLTYLPASVANLIATLEPAITAALAYLFLAERLSPPQLAGSCLIIAGVVLLRMGEGVNRELRVDMGD